MLTLYQSAFTHTSSIPLGLCSKSDNIKKKNQIWFKILMNADKLMLHFWDVTFAFYKMKTAFLSGGMSETENLR